MYNSYHDKVNINNNLSVTNNFVYNFYEKSENKVNDNFISNEIQTRLTSKYIELNVSIKDHVFHNSESQNVTYKSNLNKALLQELSNNKINNYYLKYFNNITNSSPLYELITFFKNQDKVNFVYNTNIENINSEFFSNSYKLSINKEKEEWLTKCNLNNTFFSIDNDQLSFYKSKSEKNSYNSFFNKELDLFKEHVSYSKRFSSESNTTFYSFIGFLVEKYKVNDNKIDFSDRRFYFIDQNDSGEQSLNIKDTSVNYAKSYKYVIYPVYSFSIQSYKDIRTINDYLICDVPYVTNDINCVDIKKPLPPTNIKFKYDKLKDMTLITWDKSQSIKNDIKGFQILKRKSLEDPFMLVKQINFLNTDQEYVDQSIVKEEFIEKRNESDSLNFYDEVHKNDVYIYTICAVDVHGKISNYSNQIAVKYNYSNYSFDCSLVSSYGAPLQYPNIFVNKKTKYFENYDKIQTNTPYLEKANKITIYATPDYVKINNDNNPGSSENLYKENYVFNIFKLENNKNFTDTIRIRNFSSDN